jgi:hypothetical protein
VCFYSICQVSRGLLTVTTCSWSFSVFLFFFFFSFFFLLNQWLDLLYDYDFRGCSAMLISSLPSETLYHSQVRSGWPLLKRTLKEKLSPFPLKCPIDVETWSLGGSQLNWFEGAFASTVTSPSFEEKPRDALQSVRLLYFNRHTCWSDLYETRALMNYYKPLPERPVHSKMMTRFYPEGSCKFKNCSKKHGWVYLGSHNVSASSWGTLFSGGQVQVRNWELGVLFCSNISNDRHIECGADLNQIPIPFQQREIVPYLSTFIPKNAATGSVPVLNLLYRGDGKAFNLLLECLDEKISDSFKLSKRTVSKCGFSWPLKEPSLLICAVTSDESKGFGRVMWVIQIFEPHDSTEFEK